MDNIKIVKENSEIFKNQYYILESGKIISLPKSFNIYLSEQDTIQTIPVSDYNTKIIVTDETTNQAIFRLNDPKILALNFASAKEPGGDYLRGAIAQEEDICRGSSLYHNLLTQPDYYLDNKKVKSPLYTDGIIISKDILFYRDHYGNLLENPVTSNILTCPAPMAKICTGTELMHLPTVLHKRINRILTIAHNQGYDNLILGAWGCGAFGNDPKLVAGIFKKILLNFSFKEVTFAIYDRTINKKILNSFIKEFQ